MIEFRLLGALQLTDAEGREVKSLLTRPRRLALLAYLAAATPRGLHRRDTLLALFWPELDQEHARAALRQALHIVRGALGADVLVTRGDEEIGLDVDRVACDVVAFDRAVAAGRFAEAVDAYRGPLLAGFFIPGAGEFESWLERERARLQRAASSSAGALVEQGEAAGDLRGAVEWARHAARLAPHEEDPLRHLVTLLDRLGDRAGAVDAYDEFAKRLAGDLETEPAAETQALLAAVRARATVGPVESPSRPRAGVAPAAPAPGVAAPPAPRRAALWPRLSGTGVLGLLLAASAGGWPGRPAPRRGPIRAVAVLPLESLSGDSLQGWFADGMTEALITDLGRISALRVSSRSAVTQARGTARPLRDVVRDLQVDAVVEGGVQRAGDSVRVDLRLIDGPSGYQLWAGRIAASVRDRFAIEDSVARSVAGALGVSLTPAEQRALRTAPTGNQQADELYLRAKVRIRHETRADDSVAIALLERAVALDPGFAVAHAALAHAYALRVNQFAPDDSAARERAFVSVERALRLNPDLAEAHSVSAGLVWGVSRQFATERAIAEDRRALALNPNLSDAHHHLGTIYLHIGMLDKAVAEFQQALALNPFDANAQRRIGIAQIYRGQYADGYATFRRVGPEGNPALWTYQTAWALLYLGRDSAAGALIEDYLRAHPEDRGGVVRSTRAILRAKRGDAAGAAEDIRRAVNAGVGFIHFHHSAYNIASVYAILGHPGPAVHWLRRAADEGWPCYPYFANDPNLANIRDDPGFRSFMRELQAQWERYRATL
jgi:TolB-like protein/DNA-binding SARP family transcriptional activator